MVVFTERTVRRRCSGMPYGSIMIPWMSNARTCIKTRFPWSMLTVNSRVMRCNRYAWRHPTSTLSNLLQPILSQFEETPDLVQ